MAQTLTKKQLRDLLDENNRSRQPLGQTAVRLRDELTELESQQIGVGKPSRRQQRRDLAPHTKHTGRSTATTGDNGRRPDPCSTSRCAPQDQLDTAKGTILLVTSTGSR
ncbi:MAG: hypothetical protein GEV07_21190 [Streptosporangiales bacterium]|nr:hypothetical protein [Streptosporangiales bacterium]